MAERILGIDPGLQVAGYGVIEDSTGRPRLCEAGVIRSGRPANQATIAERIQTLYDGMVEVLAAHTPSVVAVEQLYAHYAHPRTAILMAHARGVLLLAAAQKGLPVVSYNATRIKKTITGSGRAPKDQVQCAIQRELSLTRLPEPADVADALAAALCHYYVQKIPV